MSKKINYHDKAMGITRRSISKFHHVKRLGKLFYVKGHFYNGQYGCVRSSVVVVGENGRTTFEGLSWGYYGEGPRGLYELLVDHLGIHWLTANAIAYKTKWSDEVGIEWSYIFS